MRKTSFLDYEVAKQARKSPEEDLSWFFLHQTSGVAEFALGVSSYNPLSCVRLNWTEDFFESLGTLLSVLV